MFDFDKVIDRRNTNSIKYDFAERNGMPAGLLPLWVADMDFQAPPCVSQALKQMADHGIFGYSEASEEYYAAVQNWYLKHFDWQPQRKWMLKTPGVVFAISTAIRALTDPGDPILIQEPVYYPFRKTIEQNSRIVINVPLQEEDGGYRMDFDGMEQALCKYDVKMMLLCNPHNPVGRVWTREELLKLGEICLRHHVLVLSDEIHSDFVWDNSITGKDLSHVVFASLSKELADLTITCTAPSKTFNLAGLQLSNICIANRNLRRAFRSELTSLGADLPNLAGLVACQAAYEGGESWLLELKQYLQQNILFMDDFLKNELPMLHMARPEGTTLCWVDFRGTGLSDDELEDFIVSKAGLWLDAGTMFGAGGEGFERFNIACPRTTLERALEQLKQAMDAH